MCRLMGSGNALTTHYVMSSFTTSCTYYLTVCISRLMGSVNALPSDYDTSSFTTSFTAYLMVCISRLMGQLNSTIRLSHVIIHYKFYRLFNGLHQQTHGIAKLYHHTMTRRHSRQVLQIMQRFVLVDPCRALMLYLQTMTRHHSLQVLQIFLRFVLVTRLA